MCNPHKAKTAAEEKKAKDDLAERNREINEKISSMKKMVTSARGELAEDKARDNARYAVSDARIKKLKDDIAEEENKKKELNK